MKTETGTSGGKPTAVTPAESRNAVDRHVGRRLRQRRMLLGLSQERLAVSLGLTFQQIQKYERGVNRIGAGRLFDLSRQLDVPIGYFFDGLGKSGSTSKGSDGPLSGWDGGAESLPPLPEQRRENAELIRSYHRIRDPRMRACMLELCRAMAAPPSGTRAMGRVLLT